MSSKTNERGVTAAWRIALGSTLVFALGTMIAFLLLHEFVSREIQRRSDAWLTGEVSVLSDVAERTPRGVLYDRIVDEVAQLATKEIPAGISSESDPTQAVFFLETDGNNAVKLWVGPGGSAAFTRAITRNRFKPEMPMNVAIVGHENPYRVVQVVANDGSLIYLGMSERNDHQVLVRMRGYFLMIFVAIVLLGFAITFVSSRQLLRRVQRVTETAAKIDQDNLQSRVPGIPGNDEVAQLTATMNRMLDRISRTVEQLHSMSDALAHDIRSPITAVRGRLEQALMAEDPGKIKEPIAAAVEELDQLANLLTTSLDVAEARAGALRMHRTRFDLNQLIRSIVELYEPSLHERAISIRLEAEQGIEIEADAGLFHRMLANILNNAVRHLPSGSAVDLSLHRQDGMAWVKIEDNGPGFPPEVSARLFEKHVKGTSSTGHGLGLAFLHAVTMAHGGTIEGKNRAEGGTQLILGFPC